MADAKTLLTNIYEPTLFSNYFLEQMTNRNALIQSGILVNTPEMEAAARTGGRTVELPFWDDLDPTATPSVPTDTTDEIVPIGVTSDKEIAAKLFLTEAFQVANVVKYASAFNGDPISHIINRYVNWWLTKDQQVILAILSGIYLDATIAANLCNDVSIEAGATAGDAEKVDIDKIEDTRFLLGDAYGKFTSIIMHSVILRRLRKLQAIDTVHDSDQNLNIDYYNGLRVLVDDDMTVTAGSKSGYKYSTFLFSQGAFAGARIPIDDQYAPQSGDYAFEVYRNPMGGKGGGITNVITRNYCIRHPRGMKWEGSLTSGNVGPTLTQLAADNWTQAALTKNIGIAKLVTNG